jgi:DNA repair photolyase
MIREIQVKSALHFHGRKFATNYDLNIYRGCEHKCQYCFAQYTQDYLNSNFFGDIFVKTNVAEVLDMELSKKAWKGNLINISGVCDCYQPLEQKYKLMENVLRVLIKHKNPAFILTKSPLVIRDFELIKKLSETAPVCVSTSITTLNKDISDKLEPNVVSGVDRFEIIKTFSKIKSCKTCVMLMPVIPYLTDSPANIESIYKYAKEYGASGLICANLHLRGNLKERFYNFLGKNFPNVLANARSLYRGAYVSEMYEKKLDDFLREMRKKYGLYGLNFDVGERKSECVEPDLFDQNFPHK